MSRTTGFMDGGSFNLRKREIRFGKGLKEVFSEVEGSLYEYAHTGRAVMDVICRGLRDF